MHLMFYLDEAGKRVYTLKVRVSSAGAFGGGKPDVPLLLIAACRFSVRAEGHTRWQADRVGSPCPLFA